jgi:5-methylcytosine-specific restriction endonuclease McrA
MKKLVSKYFSHKSEDKINTNEEASVFINDFKEFISKYNITTKEVKWATDILKDIRKVSAWNEMVQRGPCLVCKTFIQYKKRNKDTGKIFDSDLALSHEKLKKCSRDDVANYIYYENKEFYLGGLQIRLVPTFICDDCAMAIEIALHTYKDDYIQTYEKNKLENEIYQQDIQRRQLEWENKALTGQINVSASKRFKILLERYNGNDLGFSTFHELHQMPYKDFLNTYYWDIVRNYKLYQSQYLCSLCKKQGVLHVHHITYEHRGIELQHLKDLIVLCESCHKKFHDKDVKTQEEQC